jgi:hypothetical protein
MIILLNRTSETTTYNYDDVGGVYYVSFTSTSTPVDGMVRFYDGDYNPWGYDGSDLAVMLLVFKDTNNYKLDYGTVVIDGSEILFRFDSTPEYEVGTLAENDVVTVSAVLTNTALTDVMGQQMFLALGLVNLNTSDTLDPGYVGQLKRITAGTGTYTLNLPSDSLEYPAMEGSRYYIVRTGDCVGQIAPGNGQTLNGGTSPIALASKYKIATLVNLGGSPSNWELYDY